MSLIVKMYLKSQSSMEFFTLIGMSFLGAIFFVMVAVNEANEFRIQKEFFLIKDMSLKLQKEIGLAAYAEDGYERSFILPNELDNVVDYLMRIRNNTLTINSSKSVFSVAIINSTGDFTKGTNKIEKINGRIYINN